jgi:hypothetical protein
MENNENNCKIIKTKLIDNLELLNSELFGLQMNYWTLEKNAAMIENNLSLALNLNCFDEDVFLYFRLLIQYLRDLSATLKRNQNIQNLHWFDIAIKYLLIKLK